MQTTKYKIVFAGQTLDNVSVETARSNLGKLLKASEATIERLFSGKPVVIKKDLERDQVDRYLSALNRAGVDVRTDPPLADAGTTVAPAPAPAPSEPALAPAADRAAAPAENPYSSPATDDLLPSVHCRQCGAKISPDDAECKHCGAKQPIGKARSKVTAGLLAIFLGWLGAHRFYLGQWWGIVYFLLGFLMWPIAIIEGIVFLVTPREKWDQKYGNVNALGIGVFIVVGLFVFIAIVGILAAIAIPQYAEYVARAKIQEAMPTIESTRQHLDGYILQQNNLPRSNREAGLPERITGKNLASISVQPGGIMQVVFAAENANLNEKTMLWVPELINGQVTWDCSGGTLSERFRPNQCREGKYQSEQVPNSVQHIVAVNGKAELYAPQSWSRQNLSEDAIIQLGNPYAEAYMVVHVESRAEIMDVGIDQYADVVLELLAENLVEPKVRFIDNSAINGLPAMRYRVDGVVDNLDLSYLVTVVQGKQDFYQLVAWSLAGRFSGNVEDFDYAISSFAER